MAVFRKKIISEDPSEKLGEGTLLFCRKIAVSTNFKHKKGISGISLENLLSRSNEKLRRRTFLCLKKILVSKIFMHRRGGHHGIVENILSQRTQNFVSAPFCVSETFCYGKKLWLRDSGG